MKPLILAIIISILPFTVGCEKRQDKYDLSNTRWEIWTEGKIVNKYYQDHPRYNYKRVMCLEILVGRDPVKNIDIVDTILLGSVYKPEEVFVGDVGALYKDSRYCDQSYDGDFLWVVRKRTKEASITVEDISQQKASSVLPLTQSKSYKIVEYKTGNVINLEDPEQSEEEQNSPEQGEQN